MKFLVQIKIFKIKMSMFRVNNFFELNIDFYIQK